MRLVYSLALILTLGILAGGCSSARVNSDQVAGTNFAVYKTYAWLPNNKDTVNDNGSVYNSEITNQNIRSAVDTEMMRRGITLDASNPDLLMLVHTNFEQRAEVVSRPFYSSYNYYAPGFYPGPWYAGYYYGYNSIPYVYGYGIEEVQYTQGTLIIDAIDRHKNQLVWRGWSEERLYDYNDARELYENVDNIFKEFPVKEKKR